MNKILIVSVLAIGLLAGVYTQAATTPADLGLNEGDVIGSTDPQDFDLYIVNQYGHKRLFTNPKIFGLYGHLSYSKVKRISPDALELLPTSGLFMNCETGSRQVFALEVLSEDEAALNRVSVEEGTLLEDDPHFYKKVFCINTNEQALYSASAKTYVAVNEVPSYARALHKPYPTVVPARLPVIHSITPQRGPVGTVVTITGTGFQAPFDPPVATILFNDYRVDGVIARSDSSITFTVPHIMSPAIDCAGSICVAKKAVKITPGTYSLSVAIGSYRPNVSPFRSNKVPFTVTSDANQFPIIGGVSGPTSLKVNKVGTWTISAHDPDNDYLSYRVSWGDEFYAKPMVESAVVPQDLYFRQTTTFTHAYNRPGTYTATFWVSDSMGNTARTSITVRVENTVADASWINGIQILPAGSTTAQVGSTVLLNTRGATPYGNTIYMNGQVAARFIQAEYASETRDIQILRFTVPDALPGGFGCFEAQPGGDETFCIDPAPNLPKLIDGTYKVTFKNAQGVESNSEPLTVDSTPDVAPAITSITPSYGRIGTWVTIKGTGFSRHGNRIYMEDGFMVPGTYSSYGTNGDTLAFLVPDQLTYVCNDTPGALCIALASKSVTPGMYDVFITNAEGRRSNKVSFIAIGSSVVYNIDMPLNFTRYETAEAFINDNSSYNSFSFGGPKHYLGAGGTIDAVYKLDTAYPGTNYKGAFVSVAVNDTLSVAESPGSCYSAYSDMRLDFNRAIDRLTPYKRASAEVDGGNGHTRESRIYHVWYQQNTAVKGCLEFTLTLDREVVPDLVDGGSIPAVNADAVWRELEALLDEVTIYTLG